MGPLKGMKVVEVGGIGPGPFCGQMLSDMGADVVRIDRKGVPRSMVPYKFDVWHRNRRSITLNLKKPEGVKAALKLIEKADALIEGFRPGVMEKLGLGPDVCLEKNKRLVFGRMTGWGQDGPLSQAAGHDINYIALSGALHAMGVAGGKPVVPLNLVADLGGGGMMLAFGIMCAMHEAKQSGKGQVVDATMVDGAACLMGFFYGLWGSGLWSDARGSNLLDGGAHFYDTYETADGRYISIGAIEPQFYALLLKHAEIDDPDFEVQLDMSKWPLLKKKTAEIFKRKTRDAWCKIMEGTDICFAPVLSFEEAINHPHNKKREVFVNIDGAIQPAPAPRFSRTKPDNPKAAPEPGADNDSALVDWGFTAEDIQMLKEKDVL
ncbi:MAG: CoA transferase [Proteobacteria bacterium]|nr:CoA transferase [Pseudomonadota bacterium]